MHYVYNLKCANGTIYTGCTNNLEDRLKRHTPSHKALKRKARKEKTLVVLTS